MKPKVVIRECLTNFRIGWLRQLWHFQEVNVLSSLLLDEEEILYVVTTRRGDKPGLLLLTQDRLVFVNKVLFKSEFTEMKIGNISSVDATTNIVFGKILVTTGGNRIDYTNIYRNHIYKFSESINKQITSKKGGDATKANIPDLETFALYLQKGLISQEEYDKKKKQILGF